MLKRTVLAVASGLALSAAYEPIAAAWLLLPALVGLALATRDLSVRRSGAVTLAFAVAFYFTHIAWMRHSIGPDAWAALAGIESAFIGAFGLVLPLVRRLPAGPVWVAASWVSIESIRSTWPYSGMPWGRLGFAVVDTPLAPALAYVGMVGLSFLLVLTAFVAAEALVGVVERLRQRADTAPTGLLVAVVALGAALLAPSLWPVETQMDGSAVVSVVQGDVPGPGNDILYDSAGVTANHVQATVDLAGDVAAGREPRPDVVVWPENSTATDPFETSSIRTGIEEAVAAIGVPVMVGAVVDDGPKHILNQGIVWDPLTGPGQRYTKHHPVPYGEYIPTRWLWNPTSGRLGLIRRDMRAGTDTEPLRIPRAAGLSIADAICFDVAYDDVLPVQVRNGGRLLTVQTSNASFIFTHQIEQQFAMTRLRAIETGRWLAVASTNGRTGIIDPDGEVVATADPRTTAVLTERVGLSSDLTPAMWLGPWPRRLFTVMFTIALVWGAWAYRRRQESARPVPTTVTATTPISNEAPDV